MRVRYDGWYELFQFVSRMDQLRQSGVIVTMTLELVKGGKAGFLRLGKRKKLVKGIYMQISSGFFTSPF